MCEKKKVVNTGDGSDLGGGVVCIILNGQYELPTIFFLRLPLVSATSSAKRGKNCSFVKIQDNQLNIAACFWALVKRDLSSVATVQFTSVTVYKVPEQNGHVYLVGL